MALCKKGKVLFSNVNTVDDFTGKYQIVVEISEEQAADEEAAGLRVKTKEYEGKTQHQITFKSKFKPELRGVNGTDIIDLQGGELGRGSLVTVQYGFRDWTAPGGKSGTSADLHKVQILVQQGGGAVNEFGDESEFSGEDDSEF